MRQRRNGTTHQIWLGSDGDEWQTRTRPIASSHAIQVHTVDCLSTILHLSIYPYNQGACERREKCPGRQMMSHRNPIITISSSSAHSGSQAQQPRGPSTRTPRTFDPQTYIRDMPLMMMIMMMMGITKQIDSPRSLQRKLCKTLGQMAPRPFRAESHISITP